MTTPDIQGRLVRLRQLLHGPGDPKAWESLKAVLRSWPGGSDRQVGIDYAQGLLDGWPDTVRLAEPEWVRQVLRGEPPPPIWPLVRTITTLAGQTGVSGVEALVRSPHVDHITRLSLTSYGLDDDAAALLASSDALSGLTHLALQRNRITAHGLRLLTGPESLLPEQVLLDLRRNPLDLMTLLDTPDPAPRTVVVHTQLDLRTEDTELLRRTLACPLARWLRGLNLSNSRLGEQLLRILVEAPERTALRWLDLSNCGLGEGAFSHLIVELLERLRLRSLILRRNLIQPHALRLLPSCAQLSRLQFLELGDNPIGDEGLEWLLSSPHLTELRTLQLSNCWLTSRSVRLIAEATHLHQLRTLDLSQNDLDDSVHLLLDAPHLKQTSLRIRAQKGLSHTTLQRLVQHNTRLPAPELPQASTTWQSEWAHDAHTPWWDDDVN